MSNSPSSRLADPASVMGVISLDAAGFIVVRSRRSLFEGRGCISGRGAGRGSRSAVPESARPSAAAS